MVSLSVTQLAPSCPPAVIHGSSCEYETGQYIFDINGCARKICPSLSRLCDVSRTNYLTFFFINRCFLNRQFVVQLIEHVELFHVNHVFTQIIFKLFVNIQLVCTSFRKISFLCFIIVYLNVYA